MCCTVHVWVVAMHDTSLFLHIQQVSQCMYIIDSVHNIKLMHKELYTLYVCFVVCVHFEQWFTISMEMSLCSMVCMLLIVFATTGS